MKFNFFFIAIVLFCISSVVFADTTSNKLTENLPISNNSITPNPVSDSSLITQTSDFGMKEYNIDEKMPDLLGLNVPPEPKTVFADSDVAYVDELYRRSMARELHYVNITALSNYRMINQYIIEIFRRPKVSSTKVYNLLPYLIASTYRLGVITYKSQRGNMLKLHSQLEMYKTANDSINDSIAVIADLKNDNKIKVTRTIYGILYYSKGYNKMALAYTLLKGNIWKNYTIYMLSDIIAMIDSAIVDFETMLDFSNLSKSIIKKVNGYSEGEVGDFDWEPMVDNYFNSYLNYVKNIDHEYRTLQLCYYTGNKDKFRQIIKKRVVRSIYPLITYYKTDESQNVINASRLIDDINLEKEKSKHLYVLVSNMFDLLTK